MLCKSCAYKFSNLTRVWPSFCPKCGYRRRKSTQNRPGQAIKYDISQLVPGGSTILPWGTATMMYTTAKSQVMRACVKESAKKLGWTVEVIRHIAGLKVTRLT